MSDIKVSRRGFFGAAAGAGSLLIAGTVAGAGGQTPAKLPEVETNPEVTDKKQLAALNDIAESFPFLENPTPDGMTVVWSIKRSGTGYVEWGETKKLGHIARNSVNGLFELDDRFLSARITGLKPGTTYYYRTVSIGMDFPNYGKLLSGNNVYSEIYSFTTPDSNGNTASFFVMNDTHERVKEVALFAKKLMDLKADYTIWNGDLLNDTNSADQAVKGIMLPGNIPFGAEKPILFTAGNHDHRGPWARSITKLWRPWNQNDPKYSDLQHNWFIRKGPLAMIGMDTGEDKPDFHPVWAGLANFDPIRRLQASWLEETLNRPEIKKAPFIIVFCHIPLYSADPNANPGDILERWATWQRPCAKYWSPIFKKYGVQAVITAHLHSLMPADLPDENRPWIQIHGGAADYNSNAAFIHGTINDGKLVIRQEMLKDKSEVGCWTIEPRK